MSNLMRHNSIPNETSNWMRQSAVLRRRQRTRNADVQMGQWWLERPRGALPNSSVNATCCIRQVNPSYLAFNSLREWDWKVEAARVTVMMRPIPRTVAATAAIRPLLENFTAPRRRQRATAAEARLSAVRATSASPTILM